MITELLLVGGGLFLLSKFKPRADAEQTATDNLADRVQSLSTDPLESLAPVNFESALSRIQVFINDIADPGIRAQAQRNIQYWIDGGFNESQITAGIESMAAAQWGQPPGGARYEPVNDAIDILETEAQPIGAVGDPDLDPILILAQAEPIRETIEEIKATSDTQAEANRRIEESQVLTGMLPPGVTLDDLNYAVGAGLTLPPEYYEYFRMIGLYP